MKQLTWVEIDLAALVHNLKQIRKVIGPKPQILAVVKADAYGHGAVEVAKTLANNGVNNFAVANLKEGKILRERGIAASIILLQPSLPEETKEIIRYNLIPVISNEEFARELNQTVKNRTYPVHIKIDTGMGRLGVPVNLSREFIRQISGFKNLKIEGIFSHFARAYYDLKFSMNQLKLFRNLIKQLENDNIFIPNLHIANSAAVLNLPYSRFQSVRPGIILYGLSPYNSPKWLKNISLKPVMSLKSRIIYSKIVDAGVGLSYGHTYYVKKKSTIATLPVGYSHGYSRILSNKTQVVFRGKKYAQVGIICMDSLLVNLGQMKPELGEEIILMGSQGKEGITAGELAKKMGTINYEITCRFGSSCERIYKR